VTISFVKTRFTTQLIRNPSQLSASGQQHSDVNWGSDPISVPELMNQKLLTDPADPSMLPTILVRSPLGGGAVGLFSPPWGWGLGGFLGRRDYTCANASTKQILCRDVTAVVGGRKGPQPWRFNQMCRAGERNEGGNIAMRCDPFRRRPVVYLVLACRWAWLMDVHSKRRS